MGFDGLRSFSGDGSRSVLFSRQYIIKALQLLDTYLTGDDRIVLCGSASVLLRGVDFRGTIDIDYVQHPSEAVRRAQQRVADSMGGAIYFDENAAGVVGLMYDYEDRLVKVDLQFKRLSVLVLSHRDWIVSKLASPKLEDVLNNTEVTFNDLLWVRDNLNNYAGVGEYRVKLDLDYLLREVSEREGRSMTYGTNISNSD